MAMVAHAPEATDDAEYDVHLSNYHWFVKTIWWNVAAIALVLIVLAAWAG